MEAIEGEGEGLVHPFVRRSTAHYFILLASNLSVC